MTHQKRRPVLAAFRMRVSKVHVGIPSVPSSLVFVTYITTGLNVGRHSLELMDVAHVRRFQDWLLSLGLKLDLLDEKGLDAQPQPPTCPTRSPPTFDQPLSPPPPAASRIANALSCTAHEPYGIVSSVPASTSRVIVKVMRRLARRPKVELV